MGEHSTAGTRPVVDDVEGALVMIEKAQQLAGHFPDAEALDRARRILEGRITLAEAYAELDAKYARE
ncbi:antitoxin VbhA family protein [Propionibacterium australiense]|uniref:Antitoxin VbhA-like n=1 Tax=Propionibacterium australiense TaxID=119981 RepID=A0A383S852_9ACTN|nr:antitoxin VbhA family protein [Propionibacterium australiense]RLP06746.1 hypothetical protein D7U36_12315 [Propionibacterium australiense]RLP07494.1 hypothetical protein D9T14_10270 [Propionibacterium australiense]SYZ34097.1 Antitoxin VbhA-like [Propionibacterium australiense]VEH88686.1 Uncharacterised protein [Propionibacterium australiense]